MTNGHSDLVVSSRCDVSQYRSARDALGTSRGSARSLRPLGCEVRVPIRHRYVPCSLHYGHSCKLYIAFFTEDTFFRFTIGHTRYILPRRTGWLRPVHCVYTVNYFLLAPHSKAFASGSPLFLRSTVYNTFTFSPYLLKIVDTVSARLGFGVPLGWTLAGNSVVKSDSSFYLNPF